MLAYHVAAVYTSLGRPKDALPLLETVAKEFPEFSEARVLLASVYYRLNRKEDGDREKAAVQKLATEQQAKQPGAQDNSDQGAPIKPPDNLRESSQPNLGEAIDSLTASMKNALISLILPSALLLGCTVITSGQSTSKAKRRTCQRESHLATGRRVRQSRKAWR